MRATGAGRFLEHFSRRTSGGRFIPEIDGIRFIAIASVVAVHVTSFASGAYLLVHPGSSTRDLATRALRFGGHGVELFFIVSGFVLALPFAASAFAAASARTSARKRSVDEDVPDVPLGRYYLRRLTRLEPPYIIALTLSVIVLSQLPGGHTLADGTQIGPLMPHYIPGLAYLHGLTWGTTNPVNPLTWSLEIEVQFYLVMPLLATVFRIANVRTRRAVLIIACVLLDLVQRSSPFHEPRLAMSFLGYAQYFLVGFLLVDIYLREWRSAPTTRRTWDLVTVGAFVLAAVTLPTPIGTTLLPVAGAGLFVGAFRGTLTKRILRTPWIFTIGGMCYSIYLMHALVLRAAFRAAGPLGRLDSWPLTLAGVGVLMVAVILLVSGAFFLLIERPCMDPRWPQRLINSVRRSPT